jgi:hypothetical protein
LGYFSVFNPKRPALHYRCARGAWRGGVPLTLPLPCPAPLLSPPHPARCPVAPPPGAAGCACSGRMSMKSPGRCAQPSQHPFQRFGADGAVASRSCSTWPWTVPPSACERGSTLQPRAPTMGSSPCMPCAVHPCTCMRSTNVTVDGEPRRINEGPSMWPVLRGNAKDGTVCGRHLSGLSLHVHTLQCQPAAAPLHAWEVHIPGSSPVLAA